MNKKRPRPNLIEGRMMICPRCKEPQDILQFKVFDLIQEFAHDTVPIYQCQRCYWKFAPAPDMLPGPELRYSGA